MHLHYFVAATFLSFSLITRAHYLPMRTQPYARVKRQTYSPQSTPTPASANAESNNGYPAFCPVNNATGWITNDCELRVATRTKSGLPTAKQLSTTGMSSFSGIYSTCTTTDSPGGPSSSSTTYSPVAIGTKATMTPFQPFTHTSRFKEVPTPTGSYQSMPTVTLSIANQYTADLHLFFGDGEGIHASRQSTTTLPQASTASFLYYPGWSGRVLVGKDDNKNNTKIEGSWKDGADPDFDVSLVNGYSVPVVCMDEYETVSGHVCCKVYQSYQR